MFYILPVEQSGASVVVDVVGLSVIIVSVGGFVGFVLAKIIINIYIAFFFEVIQIAG